MFAHFRLCVFKSVRLIAIKEVRNYRKTVYIKNIFENGWWEDAYPSSYPPGSAHGQKLEKPSKESGIFQSLGTINFAFFIKRQSQKKGGSMAQSPPLKYAPGGDIKKLQTQPTKFLITQPILIITVTSSK